jgi:hypothetical protein
MFSSAPALVNPLTTPDMATRANPIFQHAPTTTTSKMDDSKTDTSQNLNVWIPQKLQRSRAANDNHPNTQAQGKTARRSLMQPQLLAAEHSFFLRLKEWGSKGVPVDCWPNWTWNVIEQAVARGPHRSAMEPDSIKLVHEDIQYQVDAGFSQIMLWTDIQKLRPRNLKI